MKLKLGDRVNTPKGPGEVTGKESFYGGKLSRYRVRLDEKTRSVGNGNIYFFPKELKLNE